MSDIADIKTEHIRKLFAEYKKIDLEEVVVSKLSGGFTGAMKFIVQHQEKKYFLKVANQNIQTMDAFLIESEASIYKFLSKLQLTGTLFPLFDGLVIDSELVALVLENVNATWGGPWNEKNILLLDDAVSKLHNTKLAIEDKNTIDEIAKKVREGIGEKPKDETEEAKQKKREVFWETWSKPLGGFVNSKDEVYFEADYDLVSRILELAEQKIEMNDKLIMQDLNFANIGFLSDKVYFVDPVFMKLGDPQFDRTVVGVNILQQLNKAVTSDLFEIVFKKYFRSKVVLAKLVAYYTISSRKKLNENQNKWQIFHQECAVVALKVFVEMENRK